MLNSAVFLTFVSTYPVTFDSKRKKKLRIDPPYLSYIFTLQFCLVPYVFSICFGLFRNKSVCFGCFEMGPKHRNKPKKYFLVSRNKPKMNLNRLCFGLFRFEPKKRFFCFEDTLIGPHKFLPIFSVDTVKLAGFFKIETHADFSP
jgi:hypothetical protein